MSIKVLKRISALLLMITLALGICIAVVASEPSETGSEPAVTAEPGSENEENPSDEEPSDEGPSEQDPSEPGEELKEDPGESEPPFVFERGPVIVSLDEDGDVIKRKTEAETVGDFLEEEGIDLGEYDRVYPKKRTALEDGMTITINRGYEVTLQIADETGFHQDTVMTAPNLKVIDVVETYSEETGREFICDSERGDQDLAPDMTVGIFLVTVQTEMTNEEIPYEVEYIYLDNLPTGYEAIITQGYSGTEFVVDEVRYEGLIEVDRERLESEVTLEPLNSVVAVGTGPDYLEVPEEYYGEGGAEEWVNSQESMYQSLYGNGSMAIIPEAGFIDESMQVAVQDEPFNDDSADSYAQVEGDSLIVDGMYVDFTEAIKMSATAYTADYASTGKRPGDRYFGITASGLKAQVGVVAVDPKVIPLKTKLYVEGYGFAIAGDTGSSVKGNIIDLYFDSGSEVREFGRQSRMVYILADQNYEIAIQY